ncbi:protein yipf6 [Dermatophagoides farinae]|uniref:Protein yipf6 n=1 Tax=Dermatophagoides farinae TaxID=6954 RepID=A0A9D4P886_DERFA|nr:protein yipf6 [Dermatophagoides farinae]
MNSIGTAAGHNSAMMPENISSWDTLDEPIWDTIHRDLFNIYSKLKFVFLPVSENDIYLNVCKNWDLWGPFIFYAFIAFTTNSCNPELCTGYHQSNFSSIFVLMWIANFIISMNCKFLLKNSNFEQILETSFGDSNQLPVKRLRQMSIFQLLCLFGYSMAIPSIGILVIKISSINIYCIIKLTNIYSLFAYDMLKRKDYLWIKDIRINLIVFYAITMMLICYNLVISFRITINSNDAISTPITKKKSKRIYCLDSGIIQKIVFAINQLIMVAFFIVTMLIIIEFFVLWTLTHLCTDGSNIMRLMPQDQYKTDRLPGEMGQFLDLREFAPILGLRMNETQFLYFDNDRLKMFCDDYVSISYLYSIIFFISSLITYYSLVQLNILLASNISKDSIRKDFQDVMFLYFNDVALINSEQRK